MTTQWRAYCVSDQVRQAHEFPAAPFGAPANPATMRPQPAGSSAIRSGGEIPSKNSSTEETHDAHEIARRRDCSSPRPRLGATALTATTAKAQTPAQAQTRSLPTFDGRSGLAESAAAMEARRRLQHRDRRPGQRLGAAPSAHAQGRRLRQGGAAGDGVRPRPATIVEVVGRRRAAATTGREREHGIHIDYKGFVWIGGNNCPSNGLAGLKPVADDQLLKFTPGRQVRHADRPQQPEQGQRRHRQCAPRRRRAGLSADQRAVRRRRLRQSPRHRVRCRHRRVQAHVGRVRQQAGGRRSLRHRAPDRTSPDPGPQQLQHRALDPRRQ